MVLNTAGTEQTWTALPTYCQTLCFTNINPHQNL